MISHLSKETYNFLKLIEENNNKEWFHSHKEDYEKNIKLPLREVLKEMSKRFTELQLPYFSAPKLSLFRINRDIRFSKNKEPYKTNFGLFFPYSHIPIEKKNIHSTGLYYHFDLKESFIAGGIHCPNSSDIKKIRNKISKDWETLDNIINDVTFSTEFSKIFEGEHLKRMPRDFTNDHPKEEWIRLKDFIAFEPINFEDSYNSNLLDILEKKAVSIVNFLDFFYTAINE